MKEPGITADEMRDRRKDLDRQIKYTSKETSYVRDWFASGNGLGQLYDSSWINLANVDSNSKIRVIRGKVVHFENNNAFIRIMELRALGDWGIAPVGQRYNKASDVFFDGSKSGIISEQDVGSEHMKKMKIGFSYERMVASVISLERNLKRTILLKSEIEQEEKKKKTCNLVYQKW